MLLGDTFESNYSLNFHKIVSMYVNHKFKVAVLVLEHEIPNFRLKYHQNPGSPWADTNFKKKKKINMDPK